MNANYLDSIETPSQKVVTKSFFKIVLTSFLALTVTILSVISFAGNSLKEEKVSADNDIVKVIMCLWGDDSVPAMVYQATQTSEVQFQLRSKSTMNFGIDDVDSGMNAVLDIFGPDYKKTNEQILGAKLSQDDVGDKNAIAEDDLEFNGGNKVNPFDRFGVAGLKFTSYTGEWRYLKVDACGDGDPIDPKASEYFDGRLVPQSTWEDIPRSKDIRTIQFDKGFGVQYLTSLATMVSNGIFAVTKTFVVFVIALINFSFSDVAEVLGLNKIIGGDPDNPDSGIYHNLHENLFLPLLYIMFGITGLWVLWVGIIKRGYRQSLVGVLRSIFMMFIAFVIAGNPALYTGIPNKVAVGVQSIIVSGMSKSLKGQGTLCESDIGNPKKDIVDDKDKDKEDQDVLAGAAENMRSVIGCTFWETFLVKPWVEGQFGTDWNKLWANDEIPDWADEDSAKELGNGNDDWVGDAAVPLGDGTFINNWAIFQISTQTNAHMPLGKEGEISRQTGGVSTDWWRVVDAVSNYQEDDSSDTGGSSGSGGSGSGGDKTWPVPEDVDWTTYEGHGGIDFPVPEGTDVKSILDGEVTHLVDQPEGCGTGIIIEHSDGVEATYCHLSEQKVAEGDSVDNGDVIGLSGDTGRSTGPHLHVESQEIGDDLKGDEKHEFTVDWIENKTSGSDDNAGASGDDPEYGLPCVPGQEEDIGKEKNSCAPHSSWDMWAGNSNWSRMGTALSSVAVAGVGLLAPFVFAFLAAVYAIGTAIVTAFAPLMFLFGAGTGRFWEIFKGWAKLLLDLVIKRIVMGLLLTLTIILTVAAIERMETVGWWHGMLMLLVVAVVMLKSRNKFVQIFTAMSFAAQDLSSGMNRMSNMAAGAAKGSGRMVTSGLAGGVAAKRAGGGFGSGAFAGAKNELKNMSYRSRLSQDMLSTYETEKLRRYGDTDINKESQQFCASCGKDLKAREETIASRDANGNYYCRECSEDGFAPDEASEVILDFSEQKRRENAPKKKTKRTRRSSAFDADKSDELRKEMADGKDELSDKQKGAKLEQMTKGVSMDIRNARQAALHGDNVEVRIPKALEEYLDPKTVKEAWATGNYEYIQNAYSLASATWYREHIEDELPMSVEELIEKVDRETTELNKQLDDNPDGEDRNDEDESEDRKDRRE